MTRDLLPGLHEAQSIVRTFLPAAKVSQVTIELGDNTLRATYVLKNYVGNEDSAARDTAANALAHRAIEHDSATKISVGVLNTHDAIIVIETRDDCLL